MDISEDYLPFVQVCCCRAQIAYAFAQVDNKPISPQRKDEWERYRKIVLARLERTEPMSDEEGQQIIMEYTKLTQNFNGTNFPQYPPDFDMANVAQ